MIEEEKVKGCVEKASCGGTEGLCGGMEAKLYQKCPQGRNEGRWREKYLGYVGGWVDGLQREGREIFIYLLIGF